jgi:hypothetical protein
MLSEIKKGAPGAPFGYLSKAAWACNRLSVQLAVAFAGWSL